MDKKNYVNLDPMSIESDSMMIIQNELSHLQLPEDLAPIIKRVIHATADFEYASLFEAHDDALKNAQEALRSGSKIYADTGMIVAGVNSRALSKSGCTIHCHVHDPDIIEKARQEGITRSVAGINKAVADAACKIFVIGNAPTALVRLCELYKQGKVNPDVVIGVPIGFVGASESKDMLKKSGMPYMIIRGRKGGSPVGVAILNAILYGLTDRTIILN